MERTERSHSSICMTCNAVLEEEAYPVVHTRLGSNGTLLSETLQQCLNLPDSIFESKTVLSVCPSCFKSYEELVELEQKYRALKAQLWNRHKEVVSTWMQHVCLIFSEPTQFSEKFICRTFIPSSRWNQGKLRN